MDKQKFETILDRLLNLSEEEKLNWKTTASRETYLLVLDDSSIILSTVGLGSITFRFNNEKGETVESHSVRANGENYERCAKLFDLVRRKALNSDKTIDRILKQLEPDSIAA